MHNLFLVLILSLTIVGTAEAGFFSKLNPFRKSVTNSVPQKSSKSDVRIKCRGEITYFETGEVKGCTEGYYLDKENENTEERKMNFKERFIGFLNNLTGWLFWGTLGLMFFFPTSIGVIFGRLFNNSKTALKATIRGIKSAKNNGKNLSEEEKKHYDKAMRELIKELEVEHRSTNTQKFIDKMRAK